MSKPGSAGVAGSDQTKLHLRDRLRQIALETADLSSDPYFTKSHTGVFECRLCLTLHKNEANYMAHTQGRKHQTNLAKRAAMEERQKERDGAKNAAGRGAAAGAAAPRTTVRIGRPGYRVVKQRDPATGQLSLLFRVHYPRIESGLQPRHRLMGALEQRVVPPDTKFQFLLIAAEPYETVAFKIPAMEVDRAADRFLTHWDREQHVFTLQLHFKRPDGGGGNT